MAIAKDFLDILVHPTGKTPLQYNAATDQLTGGADAFEVKEQVPILLTKNEKEGFDYKDHYQADAVAYDYFEEEPNAVSREEINRLHQYILNEIPANTGWILDVGCGGGWLAKSMLGKNRNVISMDISDINPIKAVKNFASPHHFGLVGDVLELPIKPNSIDCIIASEIIEHIVDPKKFIEQLYNVLSPGGKLIITTPYNELIRTSLCIHCNQLTPQNAHLHSFTEKSVKRFFPANVTSYKTKIFNNKILVRFRLQRIFSFLPLPVWRLLDDISIGLTKKAYRLMIVIEKK
jgi:2-polyprenyl-3-methyl-5-hydroxy-6-metoxy-1,4-benzoquinol methylase